LSAFAATSLTSPHGPKRFVALFDERSKSAVALRPRPENQHHKQRRAAMMTIKELFAERDRRFKEVLDANPGEQRLKAFAEFEHRSNDRYDIEQEVTLLLCFLLTRNRLGGEIIELRADADAVKKRYDEIGDLYGPRMLVSVAKMVGWCSPPHCCVCHSEEEHGPDDPFVPYSADSLGPDWMHKSCMDKFHLWADDDKKSRPKLIPPIEVLDEAWRKKHPDNTVQATEDTSKTEP
jgi:hypothetical protein